jgi:hypothetical protein
LTYASTGRPRRSPRKKAAGRNNRYGGWWKLIFNCVAATLKDGGEAKIAATKRPR